jgi:hypothetical protein
MAQRFDQCRDNGRPCRCDELRLNSDEYNGAPLSNSIVAGAGIGKVPWAQDGAAANIERRADELVDSQRFGADRCADDVNQCVHCSDFVEVDLFNRYVVNFRLSSAQFSKIAIAVFWLTFRRPGTDNSRESPSVRARADGC